MGAVYSINLQAKIKQGHKLALFDSLISTMTESHITQSVLDNLTNFITLKRYVMN